MGGCRVGILGTGTATGAVLAVFAAVAVTVWSSVPAGADDDPDTTTGLTVTIDDPADGVVLPPGPVTLTGAASIGGAEPDLTLIYLLDVSAGTDSPTLTGCGGDRNGDGRSNRVLDCQLAAVAGLNEYAVGLGSVADVGVVVLADSAGIGDLGPAPGVQPVTGPAADVDGTGGRDVDQVLSSAYSQFAASAGRIGLFTRVDVGTGADFADGVRAIGQIAAAAGRSRTVAVFVSDGPATVGDHVDGPISQLPPGVDVFTFSIGTLVPSSCTAQGSANRGNLLHIATSTGGTCTRVASVPTLPTALLEVIGATLPARPPPPRLTSLVLSVDGGPATAVTAAPALPVDGPATVGWTATTGPLAAGTHQLCVTAAGAGAGTVTDCVTVLVNAAPVVDAGGPYAGGEGVAVALAGTVTDPDAPGLAGTWSVTSGGNPGAACAVVAEAVTCTDDGSYTLTLTADDGIGAPVSDTATLTVANATPVVTVSAPAAGTPYRAGAPITVTAPFTDAGADDTHSCTVGFGGAPPVAGVVTAGTCTATGTLTGAGPRQVAVTVTDDDGARGTAGVELVSYLGGEAFAMGASGLVALPRAPLATCPPGESLAAAGIDTPLGSLGALTASCVTDLATGTTTATTTIAGASLLGGLITLTGVHSTCAADATGAHSSSVVGTLNGAPVGTGAAVIGIPGVAQVFVNETTAVGRNAVRVRTLLGQEIVLAGCRLG
jgi:trimeric autotransporter adhesin